MVKITYERGRFGIGGYFENPIQEDEGVPEQLAPIGNSPFYYQPEAVDPRDCDLYPDSIYCGGNPFSVSPLDVSVEPSIDKCGRIFLKLDATVLFFNFPPQLFAYVPEGCRGKAPNEPYAPPAAGLNQRIPMANFSHLKDDRNYIVGFNWNYSYQGSTRITRLGCQTVGTNHIDAYYEDAILINGQRVNTVLNLPRFTNQVSQIGIYEYSHKLPSENIFHGFIRGSYEAKIGDTQNKEIPWTFSGTGFLLKKYFSGTCGVWAQQVNSTFTPGRTYPPEFIGRRAFMSGTELRFVDHEIHKILDLGDCKEPLWNDAPEYPPLPEDCCCMECCNSGYSDAKLDAILKEIQKANKAIGSDKFPYKVPNDMTDESAGDREITDLATAHSHSVRIIDSLTGEYPIEIEIEDSTYLEEGNQKLNLKFPNQAEMLAEIFGILYQAKVSGEAALSASMRALAENGAIRNTVTQNWFLTLAISEFLGFELAQEKKELKYAFNPEGTDLESVLKEGKSKLSIFKWKGGKDLHDHLAVYNFASQIVKGALFTPTGSAEATKQKIKDILKEDPSDSGNNDLEFDDFVRKVENGWGTEAGIDNMLINKPYGRDRQFRPNIKEIGTDGDVSDED